MRGEKALETLQDLHVWRTPTKCPVSFSPFVLVLLCCSDLFICFIKDSPGECSYVGTRVCVCVQVSIKCGIYVHVGGWICCCVCVCVYTHCKRKPEPVMRQGGRDSTSANANNLLLKKIQRHKHVLCLWFQREADASNILSDLRGNNYRFTAELCQRFYDKCSFHHFSAFVSRHVTTCWGDPYLSCHLFWSGHPLCSMGGILFLSPGIRRAVLWGLCPRIHAGSLWWRASLNMCAMQLPPSWNLSPRDR